MREIRFRALAPDKKGNLKWFDDAITDGQEVWIETKHQGIKHLKEIKALVQYTGLKDKNNVEIYEGDVLKVDRQTTLYSHYIVAWNERRAMFSLTEIGSNFIESFYDWVDTDAFSVIGNIYEHSHFLGGE